MHYFHSPHPLKRFQHALLGVLFASSIGTLAGAALWRTPLQETGDWKGSGIAYAYPLLEIPWFGVINQTDGFGAMRTAEDPDAAPGMKIWATGSDSLMFELCSGHSSEFFSDSFLEPNEVRNWKEFFLPFAGLTDVSHATKFGVVQVEFITIEEVPTLKFDACGTVPTDVWRLQLLPVLSDGAIESVALEFLISLGPDGTLQERLIPLPTESISSDLDHWQFEISEVFSGEERMIFTVRP